MSASAESARCGSVETSKHPTRKHTPAPFARRANLFTATKASASLFIYVSSLDSLHCFSANLATAQGNEGQEVTTAANDYKNALIKTTKKKWQRRGGRGEKAVTKHGRHGQLLGRKGTSRRSEAAKERSALACSPVMTRGERCHQNRAEQALEEPATNNDDAFFLSSESLHATSGKRTQRQKDARSRDRERAR